MKKLIAFFLLTSFCSFSFAQSDEQKVNDLISKMTLEEKVGQMTQVTFALIAKGSWGNTDGALDPATLKKAVVYYKVGSLLNTGSNALSVDTWRQVITQIQDK